MGSDEEIYKAMMDSKSRAWALQAKAIIEKYYIETIDEPYARKLENILADFARSTWLVDAQNTKYHCLLIILHANSYYHFN